VTKEIEMVSVKVSMLDALMVLALEEVMEEESDKAWAHYLASSSDWDVAHLLALELVPVTVEKKV
jgi:hypothetical protein